MNNDKFAEEANRLTLQDIKSAQLRFAMKAERHKEVTKKQPMSDTLQEREDAPILDHDAREECSDLACPCHEWVRQQSTKEVSGHEPMTSDINSLLDQLQEQLSVVIKERDELRAERTRLREIAKDALRFREEVNGKCDHNEAMTKLCTQCEIRAALNGEQG